MPKPAVSAERKAARVLVALGVALAGIVGAAHVSDTHHPHAGTDERAIATAVSAADPAPPARVFPALSGSRHTPTRLALVREASGDPLLAKGFGGLRTAAPLRYANLTVFPVYRTASGPAAPEMMTLGAAMGNGLVSVAEPNLTATNTGPQPTYVPGGTVVPGGNQDQGVARDAVLPAQSGAVALASYCVEEGRSMGPSPAFHADVAMAIPAVRYAMQSGDQQAVWGAVASATDHFDAHSDTRAYHTLDNSGAAQEASQPYVTSLAAAPSLAKAVGVVVSINGRIVCADVYRDPALFAQLWPALLRSYALQAAMVPAADAVGVTRAGAGHWLAVLDAAPGAQTDGSAGVETARVCTPAGAGARTAALVGGKALLHEAFWTSDAALTNRS